MALVPYNLIECTYKNISYLTVGQRSKPDNVKAIVEVARSLIDKLMYKDLLLLLSVAESIILELQDDDLHDTMSDDICTSLVTIQKVKNKALSLLSS